MIHLSSYHSNGLPTVVWSNKVNLIGEKVYKPKIHFCEHCNKPILIYGRLIPCKHVFCFTCAQEQSFNIDKGCHRCGGRALRVERNTLNSIFVCQVDSCKRAYLSARDLQAHVTHRHNRNKTNSSSSNHGPTASSSASAAAISSSPYMSTSTLLHLNNQHTTTNNRHALPANSSPKAPSGSHSNHHSRGEHHGSTNRSSRDREGDRYRERDRDRDRFSSRTKDSYQRDRERERDSKEYHRQSLQRAAQWAEASAQMLEKGLTR